MYDYAFTCINQEFCWEDHGISAPFGCPWEEVCVHVRNHVSVQEVWRLLYLCNEKIHAVLHGASEIMRWGNLINTSGEGPEGTHKINVKGPGSNVNHRDATGSTMMGHARGKECAALLGSSIQGCLLHF